MLCWWASPPLTARAVRRRSARCWTAISQMRTELNRYQVAFTETATENRQLKKKNKTLSASLDKAKEGSVLKRLEDAKLRQDYEAALKTLDSIPPEVIRFYENRTQEPVVRHDK